LEAAGRPTVVVATTAFEALAREAARAYGLPDARIATVEHPIGGIGQEPLLARAEVLADAVLALLAPRHR